LSNTSEFAKAWNNYKPRKKRIITHRAYYEGEEILFMRSGPEDEEWPEGDWITVTREEYDTFRPGYEIVKDGKIVKPKRIDPARLKLEKAAEGEFTSLPNNIIFVAEKGDNYKPRCYNG
jgi:hypothetical protein